MSLYLKYRPQSFAEVTGQDPVVTTLEQAAKQDKLSHAFLFSGSRGTGKTSVARILAKILMTQGIADENLKKSIELGIVDGNMVDLMEIDAASNRKIDDVRDLIGKIKFTPVAAKAKVYIIDEAHMITKDGFDALLKTLEEPPNYAYFILATTELSKIPPTIQSRCQCYSFRAIREEDIIRRLQFIADHEHISIDREALRTIAHCGQGSMRDAISILDQLRSLPRITTSDVEERIGKTGREYLEPLFEAIDNKDLKAIISIVRSIEDAGITLDVFARMLLGTIRNMLHEAIGKKQDTFFLHRMLDVLLQAMRDIRISPLPGLVLESALISLCQSAESPGKGEPEAKLVKSAKTKKEIKPADEPDSAKDARRNEEQVREKHLEQSGTAGGGIQSASVEAVELSLENIKEFWPQVIESITVPSAKMSLKNGHVLDISEKKLLLGFTSSFHKDKISSPETSRLVEEMIMKVLKRSMKLECVIGDGKIEGTAPEPDVDLAQAAAEVF